MRPFIRKNSILLITVAILIVVFAAAGQGMGSKDFVITLLRGLSVGAVTFLVASGFSLIFGLLDVLNLAQGTLYMVGAYIGWTMYVRPDTFVDLIPLLALIVSGFALNGLWGNLAARNRLNPKIQRFLPWGMILLAIVLFALILPRYPIAIWNLDNYAQSPVTYSFMADQGTRLPVTPAVFEKISPALAFSGLLAASCLIALGLSLFGQPGQSPSRLKVKDFVPMAIVLGIGILGFASIMC